MLDKTTLQQRFQTDRDGYILILWGNGFDELTAVSAITCLREAGRQVKIVGLQMRPMAGAFGVRLVPDISLDKALRMVDQLSCLILPCDDVGWQRLRLEPRVARLLYAVEERQISIISDVILHDQPITNTVSQMQAMTKIMELLTC